MKEPKRPWTDKDDSTLKRGKRTGLGPSEIGIRLQRPEESVRRRAIALSIPWVDE